MDALTLHRIHFAFTITYHYLLDWYTVLGGVLALAALACHGACWVVLKTTGRVEQRARMRATRLVPIVGLLTAVSIPATVLARPASMGNYLAHPVLYLAPAAVAAGLLLAWLGLRQGHAGPAFAGMTVYLSAMMVGAAMNGPVSGAAAECGSGWA